MRTANRFAIAVHALTLLEGDVEQDYTSEYMAGSIGVNPVVVRNVLGMLRRAGLVRTQQGVPGAQLARDPSRITLLEVYRAVEPESELFSMHNRPNPNCPVGANIQASLEGVFSEAQASMEQRLAATTLADVVQSVKTAAAANH
jgi:Rrf2 family protein